MADSAIHTDKNLRHPNSNVEARVTLPKSEPVAIAALGLKDETPYPLTPEFLKHCQQELARCIGPMASLILQDILAQNLHLSPQQLIELLAAEIPDRQQAEAFIHSLRSAISR